MSFSIEFADDNLTFDARIKVVGVGGSGGNAVNTMIQLGLEGVEFVCINTDAQALNANAAPTKLQVGATVTRGLGAGADPDRGRKAAMEDVNKLKECLAGADMVFVTAGMGGGTGTGAAPIIAQVAREEGALVVGVATKPFLFEGKMRARRAEQGLELLRQQVDTLVTIPNEKLLGLEEEDLSFVAAFRKADEVLYQAVKGISDLITQSGLVNVDFADVRTVMSNMGRALMGTGCAKGEGRARLAAELAVTSPLLDELSVEGATGVLINVTGGADMKMREVNEAASYIQQQAHEDANIIFGATIDEHMGDALKVTVIATGFDRDEMQPMIEVNEESANLASVMAEPIQLGRRTSSRPAAEPTSTRRVASRHQVDRHHDAEISARSFSEPASVAAAGRDRAPTLFSGNDVDWDTPAYQRRPR